LHEHGKSSVLKIEYLGIRMKKILQDGREKEYDSVAERVIKYAEKLDLLVIAAGDKLMEVRNSKGFRPKEWRFVI
jgi:hypothetical protein